MTRKNNNNELDEVVRIGRLRKALKSEMREVARDELRKAGVVPKNNTRYKIRRRSAHVPEKICDKCGKPKPRVHPSGAGATDAYLGTVTGHYCKCR